MKILITGISGFLGRAINDALKKDQHQIIGISNEKTLTRETQNYKIDITRRKELFDFVKKTKPDVCIHLAAKAHADIKEDKQRRVRNINVDGSLNLADALENAGIRDLIFFSSAKVLANTTSSGGIDEEIQPMPEGIYSKCKHEVEEILLERTDAKRLNTVIVRPVAVVGPDDSKGNYAKMFRMIRRGFFPMVNGGRAQRSIVFVENVAERIRKMMEKGLRPRRIYVFEDGCWSLKEIVDAMRTATGYAFCPEIRIEKENHWVKRMGKILSYAGGDREVLSRYMERLTASFVVRSHLWCEDYGEMPQVDLVTEMRKIVLKEKRN